MTASPKEVAGSKRQIDIQETDDVPLKVANIPSSETTRFPISFAVSLKGEREELQDAHVCIDNFRDSFGFLNEPTQVSCSSYYCLCDGHSGCRAAVMVTKTLHGKVVEQLRRGHTTQRSTVADVESDLKRAIIESYKQIDEEFLKKSLECKPPWKDGTTVTNVIIINRFLYVANVGDTRAVLFRKKKAENDAKDVMLQPIPLTKDHTAGMFEERQRIQKAGGTVKDGRVLGMLEVSRSIGDGPYKGHGVTCVPEVKRLQLTVNDEFLILACDGLWKVMEAAEVASILMKIVEESPSEVAKQASQQLAVQALRKLSGDNVTVITVDLRPVTANY